mgnify:CR=1 FL=1
MADGRNIVLLRDDCFHRLLLFPPTLPRSEHRARTQRRRVAEKTHQWCDSDWQRKHVMKRVEDGTHNFLGGKIQKENQIMKEILEKLQEIGL